MSEWISVEDRLPEKYEDVLIFDAGSVAVASRDDFDEFIDNDFWAYNPTHWMPLPEPPEC